MYEGKKTDDILAKGNKIQKSTSFAETRCSFCLVALFTLSVFETKQVYTRARRERKQA